MKHLSLQRRTLALVAVLVTLFALLVYVAVRSGPLAPVAVTVAKVESRVLTPSLFGIGNRRGTLHLQNRPDDRWESETA